MLIKKQGSFPIFSICEPCNLIEFSQRVSARGYCSRSLDAIALAFAACFCLFGQAAPVLSAGVDDSSLPILTPYRAVYEISLSDKKSSMARPAALTSLSGRMVYELSGSECEGYSTTQRLVTSSEFPESVSILEDVQLAGFETADGQAYQFVTRRLVDQNLIQSQKGFAEHADGVTTLSMKEPKVGDLVLRHDVLFPVRWFRELISAAKQGETLYTSYQFDGADKVGDYFQTTVTIGAEGSGETKDLPSSVTKDTKHWPVRVAYYQASHGTEDMAPLYEISTVLFENGINGSLYLDFGNYALDARLKELKILPKTSCD